MQAWPTAVEGELQCTFRPRQLEKISCEESLLWSLQAAGDLDRRNEVAIVLVSIAGASA